MKLSIIKNMAVAALCAGAVAGSGCKKFLKESDPTNLAPASYYTLPEHAEAAIASVYAELRFISNGTGIYSNNWQMLDAPTGIVTTETAQNSDYNNLLALVHDGTTLHVVQNWNGLYRVIAQTNLVLNKVPGITPMDAAQKARILGEARFVRAWAYFDLVRLWGDVPLITEPQTATSKDFYPSRTAQETVYKQITDDLTAAEGSGLPWVNTNGRVSMGAIKAELAKVYLTMAGQPLNKGASHYTLAAAKAKEVIDYATANPSQIGLFPRYADLRNPANNNKLEYLFEIQYNYTSAGTGNPLQSIYLPLHKPVSAIDGIGTSVCTADFYASYEAGDLRAVNGVGYFFRSYYTNGSEATLYDPGNEHVFKYFDTVANGTLGKAGTRNSDLNLPQIRYADLLLIYAEAQNEANGAPDANAYAAFKLIRDRAQLTTPAPGTYTQQTFREAVWRERWHELCYESLTWFDMVRLRKVYNEGNNSFDNFVGHVNKNSGQALQSKHLLFPLPTPEMKNNPNLRPQNPGYPQ
ncbi:MAG: RagB/SusD family nutrient uptake outer membrane protein [Bacteroidetes bacterium]|nr:RagB/SusD family nutrient uptake outer membrane protein [Bacteroidota bacterium]